MEFIVKHGNLDEIRIHFGEQSSIIELCNLLAYAVRYEHMNIIDYAIQCGADPNLPLDNDIVGVEEEGTPVYEHPDLLCPMEEATLVNSLEILKYLYEHGALIHKIYGILEFPIRYGNLSMVEFIVGCGVNLSIEDLKTATKYNQSHVVDYILSHNLKCSFDDIQTQIFRTNAIDIARTVSLYFKSLYVDVPINWNIVM